MYFQTNIKFLLGTQWLNLLSLFKTVYAFLFLCCFLNIMLPKIIYIIVNIQTLTEIDKCQPNPCKNGVCNNVPNGTVCICDAGYTGKLCDDSK